MWLWDDKPKAIYLNIKANWIKKVTDAPVIENYKTKEYNGKFYWDLIWISIRPESDQNKYETIQLEFIDDKEDRYIVSTTFTNIATSIINSLVGWVEDKKKFKNLCISLYKKDEHARVGMFSDWDMLSRHHDIKDLLAMTKKVKVNWKEVTDRVELNEFLRWEIEKISKYLKWLNTPSTMDDMEDEVDFIEDIEKEAAKAADEKAKKATETKKKADDWDLPF